MFCITQENNSSNHTEFINTPKEIHTCTQILVTGRLPSENSIKKLKTPIYTTTMTTTTMMTMTTRMMAMMMMTTTTTTTTTTIMTITTTMTKTTHTLEGTNVEIQNTQHGK